MPAARKKAKALATPSKSKDFELSDFDNFLNISQDLWLIIDQQGEIIKSNSALQELTGLKEKQIQKKHFIDFFSEQDREELLNAMQSFYSQSEDKNQTGLEYEARIITKDGEPRWMQWKQQLCGDMLYCVGKDIQDSKEREKAMIRHESQLSEAESIGRMGHWSWVLGGDDIKWSAQIYRIFGVEKGKFEPTLDTMNAMVDKSDIMRVNQVFERAIIEENNYDMEFSIQRPDGETRFIHCEGRCAFDENGEVHALYGIMQDMTERVLYERDLKAAKEQAEHAYAAKTQFLANMSHELRTPLNAIIGFSEMIERQLLGPIGTEKYLEYIGGIRESGEHLLDLISDILDMSKIEAGKYELDLEQISIGKIIKLAAHMIEGRAHDAGVKVVVDPKIEEKLQIVADRRAVLQICLNLMSNAVKFTREGGRVDISLHEREDYLSLKVIDNGIGIPANKLANITKPFEQVSSSYARDHEGSGLGLAITKELAEMHGGALFIESTLDVGTSVTIRLPYDAHAATQAKAQNKEKIPA